MKLVLVVLAFLISNVPFVTQAADFDAAVKGFRCEYLINGQPVFIELTLTAMGYRFGTRLQTNPPGSGSILGQNMACVFDKNDIFQARCQSAMNQFRSTAGVDFDPAQPQKAMEVVQFQNIQWNSHGTSTLVPIVVKRDRCVKL